MWSSSLTLLPQSGWFTDWDRASPAFDCWNLWIQQHVRSGRRCRDWRTQVTRKRSTLGLSNCCATQRLAIGFRKFATNMGREKSLAKTLGSDVIVAMLKNERACFVSRMQNHLFAHGVGNRRISSHEGVSNPFRGSVRIQLLVRTV